MEKCGKYHLTQVTKTTESWVSCCHVSYSTKATSPLGFLENVLNRIITKKNNLSLDIVALWGERPGLLNMTGKGKWLFLGKSNVMNEPWLRPTLKNIKAKKNTIGIAGGNMNIN